MIIFVKKSGKLYKNADPIPSAFYYDIFIIFLREDDCMFVLFIFYITRVECVNTAVTISFKLAKYGRAMNKFVKR